MKFVPFRVIITLPAPFEIPFGLTEFRIGVGLSEASTLRETGMVTVLSGAWYLGQGDKPDRDRTTKVMPGTFFTEPAKEVHYEFTAWKR